MNTIARLFARLKAALDAGNPDADLSTDKRVTGSPQIAAVPGQGQPAKEICSGAAIGLEVPPESPTTTVELAWAVAAAAISANALDPRDEILGIGSLAIGNGNTSFNVRLRFWNGCSLAIESGHTNRVNATRLSQQIAIVLSDPDARRVLKGIGYWCQEPGRDSGEALPDPTRLPPHSWDVELKRTVMTYLRSCHDLGAFCGYSWCRFRCGVSDSEMGATHYTDGVYLWPEGLVHYVGQHDVPLPEAFIQNAEANRWQPSGTAPRRSFGTFCDNREWIEWVRHQRTGA